ncbi:MAG: LysR family transcriptional regulator [SAR324 cluster bacterium]|nr:LysR family transcriptional regulator [SAR324 cluster bacterium]
MNARQIEAFQAVMRTGSMTLAGKLLYISQPAVSRLVNELEQNIGFKLFVRRKSGMHPTHEGKLLFEDIEKHFIGLRELEQIAESIKSSQKGQLRIIAMPGVVNLLLPKVMKFYWQKFPNINVEIESIHRIAILDRINSKHYDIGIANLPIDNSEICIHSSFDTNLHCVMREDHPLGLKDQLNITDLEGQDIILFPVGTFVRHQIENLFEEKKVQFRAKLSSRSTSDIYQFVRFGAGISLIFPFHNFEGSDISGLVFKPVNIDFKMTIGVISSGRTPSIAAQNFINLMKEMQH